MTPQAAIPDIRHGPGDHARAILALGLPLVGSQLAQFAVGLTDTVMIGWYGVGELAALVLANTCYYAIFILGAGFGVAVMPVVASAAGTANEPQVRRVTRMGMWVSVIFGIASAPLFVWSRPILEALGQDPAVAADAQTYLRIIAIGLIPNLLIVVLRSYLSALGRAGVVLWVMLATAVLNGLLNYALIFGNWGAPELGIRGAAIASVVLQVAGLVALILYCRAATPQYALFQRLWRPDHGAFLRILRLGWPIGLTSLAEVGLFTASAMLMGLIGTTELAAHGIALTLASATFTIHIGLSNTATIRAGRAFGRRDEADLRLGAMIVIAMSLAFAACTVIVFLAVPETLIALFLSPGDPLREQILVIGATFLAMAALFQLADSAQVMALGLLRGVQDTRAPMLIATLSYWVVGLPASYLLGIWAGYGGVGVWSGLVLGLACAGGLLMNRFWGRAVRIAQG